MRIILSRKGIDSSFGNFASPIFPDGRMISIPIPENASSKPNLPTYAEIAFGEYDIGTIISQLTGGKISSGQTTHLDPDISMEARPRKEGWRPAFGQTGIAERHLRNQGVTLGDIFIFFGWFKEVELSSNRIFSYKRETPDLHVLFGWLQIGEIYEVGGLARPPRWLEEHPHLKGNRYGELDVVYIASDELTINGSRLGVPGGGVFPRIRDEMILTAPGKTRSIWNVPGWLYPQAGRKPLSYHEKMSRWGKTEDSATLTIASRGQEFVLNASEYPESTDWVRDIILGSVL